jgi:UDP:flavonoid glycosyltransferase YjiC (YdhE family)
LRLRSVPSIFICHQTEPILHPLFRHLGLPVYRSLLRRFAEVWVPDHAGPDRLSGALSAPDRYPRVRFIGPLSRFAAYAERDPVPIVWDTVTLLSGPEPQRSYLEAELLPQLRRLPGRHLLVRGLPGTTDLPAHGDRLRLLPSLYGEELATTLAAARLVICRSGYSTLMDLRALDKPAILIPTPGQTEQGYLAGRAAAQGWARVQQQGRVDLSVLG